jgi:pimeloyl-ACP methyl ester carboxylesterase
MLQFTFYRNSLDVSQRHHSNMLVQYFQYTRSFGMDLASVGVGPHAVVAVHGIQGTRAVWRPVADRLSDITRFFLPNLRGRSGAARGHSVSDYGLDGFADDLAEVIDTQVAGHDYWLAGWSLGVSVVLQHLSRTNLSGPRGIILASGTPAICDVSWFSSTDDNWLMPEIADRERRLGLKEAADHDAVAWTWKAIHQSDQRAMLGSLNAPTLILHGTDDDDCPVSCARQLAKGIPNSDLQFINGAGHSIPVTHAYTMATAIRQFIQGHSESRIQAI